LAFLLVSWRCHELLVESSNLQPLTNSAPEILRGEVCMGHEIRVLAVALVSSIPVACEDGRTDRLLVAHSSAAIAITNVDDDEAHHNASVVIGDQGAAGCSGTLITPLRVLSANHCFAGSAADFSFKNPVTVGFGRDITTIIGVSNPAQKVKSATPIAVIQTGDFNTGPSGNPLVPGDSGIDIAVVSLAQLPRLGTAPGTWNVVPVHQRDDVATCVPAARTPFFSR
jgi:hypothetical protein